MKLKKMRPDVFTTIRPIREGASENTAYSDLPKTERAWQRGTAPTPSLKGRSSFTMSSASVSVLHSSTDAIFSMPIDRPEADRSLSSASFSNRLPDPSINFIQTWGLGFGVWGLGFGVWGL